MNSNAKYIYAVVSCAERGSPAVKTAPNYGPIGIEGSPVYALSEGWVAAVVSDVHNAKIRPQRRHLAAHQEVLKRLMGETTPLPTTFGIIADGPEAVRRFLSRNQESLVEQLQRVAGKVEMGLSVTYDAPNIFEYFVNTHPELRVARDRFFSTQREPTQEEKIELGRMFDRFLHEDRETHTAVVEGVLLAHRFVNKRNKCRNEQEVMNLACLVGREDRAEFEASLFEAARLFDDYFVFDYNGPWAPHNFVELDLER